ncbi:velvet factor-domain-containing protein [Microdochium bolleyi]|uniref:Velvet factor-domain-containing protein n=1 Tax=Microdochium bolleyi TaxID=196109 RepID=A0A136JEE3_9PEZI|nr:velvet factor-domain-containing protein [Microdochium bolleyi]
MSTTRGGPYPLPSIRQQFGASLNHHSPSAGPSPPLQGLPMPMPPAPVQAAAEARPVHASGPRELQGHDGCYSYKLVVGQQPNRARMCGFGDKDRRPITPPPCVQIVVRDLATGVLMDPSDLSYQHFILNVDLWNEDGTKEVGIVKHAQAQSTSFQDGTVIAFDGAHPNPRHARLNSYAQQEAQASAQYNGLHNAASPTTTPNYGYPMPVSRDSVDPNRPQPGAGIQHIHPAARNSPARMSTSQQVNSCTRNLVGNGSMSAQRLSGTDEKPGMWFVLQDLSVRTEGIFRLRFTFINALAPGKSNPLGVSDPELLNKGVCKILASTFSEPFQVYSAKKFPGVCESTELSRKFAAQGVKIPVRKEGEDKKNKKRKLGDGEDEDDEGDNDEDEN